jgi:RsmE family RNA methyltransferase
MSVGDTFDVGVINGPRGKAIIVEDDHTAGMRLRMEWTAPPDKPFPIALLIGLPRPQTARKILQETTSMGVSLIIFFDSDKGESSYRQSRLWATAEWKRHLTLGAEQAFTTWLPEVFHFPSLHDALGCPSANTGRYALDVYEAAAPLSSMPTEHAAFNLAVGSERGWSPSERTTLRENGYQLVDLGERILRTETACTVAIAIIAAQMGWM